STSGVSSSGKARPASTRMASPPDCRSVECRPNSPQPPRGVMRTRGSYRIPRMRITVLGAGSWGTALAKLLGDAGHEVALWMRSADQARDMAEKHENVKYLPGAKLADN